MNQRISRLPIQSGTTDVKHEMRLQSVAVISAWASEGGGYRGLLGDIL